jgi:predicted DNA-binding transcriptional regulator YafY
VPGPAARLITLIMLLQRRPNQRAADLAAALGVSVRTLHRYIAELDEMGIPIYSERGPSGGFSLVRGYKMPPLVFTPQEAVAVYLGTSLVSQMWGRPYGEAAAGALAKLDNVLPEEQRHEVAWARRSLVAMGLHRGDLAALAPTLEGLRLAVRDRRRVRITYRALSRPEPASREVDFYALVHRFGWWYAVGYCHLRRAVRMFRIDRIVEWELLEQEFKVPPRFDVAAFLAQEQQTQPHVRALLRFKPAWAHLALDNRAMWDTLAEQSDGTVLVTLLSPDLNWAAATASGFGPTLVVEQPAELRAMMREWAQATLEAYGDSDPGDSQDPRSSE